VGEITLDGRAVTLSNEDKILFPDDTVTKLDLIRYYEQVAPAMLPHLAGRPLTMERFPDGINAQRFYQKSASKHFPNWIRRVRLSKHGGTVDHVVVADAATLVYLANQAAVTFHTGLSRDDDITCPDQLIIDLDPANEDFGLVRKTAIDTARLMRALDLVPFVKTTGSRGLHVVAPLDGSARFEDTREVADRLAATLAAEHPDDLTTEVRKNKREGRLFLDTGRNAYGQHAVAAYSVRARPGVPVSAPLEWNEVDARLTPTRWNLRNVPRRLAQRPCPWRDMYASARPAATALERLRSA